MNYYKESLQNKQNDSKSMTEKAKVTDMKQGELKEQKLICRLRQMRPILKYLKVRLRNYYIQMQFERIRL